MPEEYAQLLEFFQCSRFRSYLELGVGKGGSFLVNSQFIAHGNPEFSTAHCVDSLQYGQDCDTILSKVSYLRKTIQNVIFFKETTDNFFANNSRKYDCIFIDADYSYEGVKRDHENAVKALSPGGVLVLHDINSVQSCPGVVQLWNEVKRPNDLEFVASQTCGIGISFAAAAKCSDDPGAGCT